MRLWIFVISTLIWLGVQHHWEVQQWVIDRWYEQTQ